MSIYSLMKKDWKTYCLMAGILYIEEVSKPYRKIYAKKYKKKVTFYPNYKTMRLKMKDEKTVKNWFDITRDWEKKLGQNFIGFSFKEIKIEKYSGQFYFCFTPNWLYYIMKTINEFPSKYVNSISIKRLKNWKITKNKFALSDKKISFFLMRRSLYSLLFRNKKLAAGAFIISFDLEFRGVTTGRPALCMSERYKDFLEFMLRLAIKYGWSTRDKLSPVSVRYSKMIGINASPQFEFRLSSNKLKEIYDLSGPLCEPSKDKAISFHANRSNNYVNLGGAFKFIDKRDLIVFLMREKKLTKTTELQYYLNIGVDVILDHLRKLEKEGKINKVRDGKRYIWSLKDAG